MSDHKHTNRLSEETSPYLLQHAHNPVDWYPWGEEAFARARSEDKPVFLSIGYSACHWCHVMERESFENESIAALINQEFVAIKVDREERPDVDSIYMDAVQLMTGHGGWPMSMFLTPGGEPFYGGTYFPPEDNRGMPSFPRVLTHVAGIYRSHRDQVSGACAEIRKALDSKALSSPASAADITHSRLDEAARRIASNFDPVHGGFGSAPKFPPSMNLDFLIQVAHRTGDTELRHVVEHTLRKMALGGMYDQIGGGFHRYSVDARWLVPHFEKMLYDNALLARLYVRAWQWSRDGFHARVVHEILGFVEREMTSPEGGFYSALDADSEGVEGKFYVWSRGEVMELLGPEEGRIFCAMYDISDRGNWEESNIPNVPRDPENVAGDLGVDLEKLLDAASRGRCQLYGARSKRIWPGLDDKVLAGWNGWMLAAFAEAALAFGRESLQKIVRKNADFLIDQMIVDGKLYRTWKKGRARIGGLLEDYSGVAWGLIAAFEATQDFRYLESARHLGKEMIARFEDAKTGGFFDTPSDHEKLIIRPKDIFDNATPAGNSVAADVLLRLAIYFGDSGFEQAGTRALESVWSAAVKYSSGFGFVLGVAEWRAGTPKEIVITGKRDDPRVEQLIRIAGEEFVPHRVLVAGNFPGLPLLEGRDPDRTAAYVCQAYRCLEPTDDPERLRELLRVV